MSDKNPFKLAIDSLNIDYKMAPKPMENSCIEGIGVEPKDHKAIAKDIPCQAHCPAKTRVPEYIEALFQGDPDKAYLINQEDNVFSGVLGRTCSRPCETGCRHNWTDINGPVSICHLKRSASDYKTNPPKPLPGWFEETGKHVAVIGGGPAGLTAAREARRYGHKVTIFERESYLGGMMVQGIPVFRLPRDVVEAEVKAIIDSGIDVEFNADVDAGKMQEIIDQYDAVIVSVGTMKPSKLDLPGMAVDGKNVVSGLEFMKDYNFDNVEKMDGQDVIIIGGGFTAVDCARSCARAAKRLVGREGSVKIMYRRSTGQMAADHDEVEQMEMEEIGIETLMSPVKANYNGDALESVTFSRNKLDDLNMKDGKPGIIPIENSDYDYPCNMLIVAIGQSKQLDILPEGIVQTDGHNTSNDKVFFSGDFNYGSLDVITAVQDGKDAAAKADTYLMGEVRMQKHVGIKLLNDRNGETGRVREHDLTVPVEMPKLPLNERDGNVEVDLGHTEDGTHNHASRCYFCHYKYEIDQDKCIHCDWCVEVAPRDCINRTSRVFQDKDGYDASAVDAQTPEEATFIWIDSKECIRCGQCYRVCPVGAISMRKTELVNCKTSELKALIAKNKPYDDYQSGLTAKRGPDEKFRYSGN